MTATDSPLPASVLTRKQEKRFTKELPHGDVIVAKVRYDDACGNGNNTFSITGEVYDRTERIPGEASAVNSHNKRRWLGSCGCLHDEITKAFPELAPFIKWHLCSSDGPMHYVANTVYWAKEGNFPFARSSAIWPEATDEELSQEPEAFKAQLLDRLPALMAEFKAAVESLGFTY